MKYKVYSQKKWERKVGQNHTAVKTIGLDTASSFYLLLEKACTTADPVNVRYDMVRDVFRRVVEQGIADCRIAFVGAFAKLDYCIKEYQIPYRVASLIQLTRKELFPEYNRKGILTESKLAEAFPHNLKATALLVYHICGKEPLPESLKRYFPIADRNTTWGKFDERVMRVVVERWDDDYIWATEEMNNSTLKICYGKDNRILTREGKFDWGYLKDALWEGAQLNLVRLRKDDRGEIYYPELIILEPDYLVNITNIANCFTTYAESAVVNLINKIKPQSNTLAIHLGLLAGRMLDDTIHGRHVSVDESVREFVKDNVLALIACGEVRQGFAQFKNDAAVQQRNIDKLIGHDLPQAIGEYNSNDVMLEPTFFSDVLGIQGRFDLLYEKDGAYTIIEQKSGKGEFVGYNTPGYDPDVPRARECHAVQIILYRALFQYQFNKYAEQLKHLMLLYSKYEKGLLMVPQSPELLLRAIKIRNMIAWSEIMYAQEGMDILTQLTPDKLNSKKSTTGLWERYTRQELSDLLDPIGRATDLERAYYLRFMRFIENETLLSKVGNREKEDSGFANIWHATLEDKKAAGNIFDSLSIDSMESNQMGVCSVTFKFNDTESADATNFRVGDIVILYRYEKEQVPDACQQMIIRANIEDIGEQQIRLRLRYAQNARIFDDHQDDWWAIEHDMFESSSNALYSGMHSFLSATKSRRDLILLQRDPKIDTSCVLKGNYGNFNTLTLRAKQARDLFLIIGPPGTGKTSYGLVNLLKEELLEEGTSVLLLSYTNRAVDEICSKLVEIREEDADFDFIRIGSELSCAKEYCDYLLSNKVKGKTGNAVKRLIDSTRVFCGTTAAFNASLSIFSLKHFSLAIIDESSQILEPHLIGLLSAHDGPKEAIDRIVMIGDHKQLPAVVQQSERESAVSETILHDIHLTDCRNSLFERLLAHFKTAGGYDSRFVYMLTKQGRMHRDIADFPNHAFYGDKLDVVPLGHQLLPQLQVNSDNGIVKMLATHRIAFVAAERPRLSPSVKTNAIEARMIAATVFQIYKLTEHSFSTEATVGVIVPYRNQISTVRNAIDQYGISVLHDITIDTVERYQGSQRDYIVYGFTVHQPYQLNFLTNNVFEEEGVIIDRKLNVAMTRARLNLIMVGNPALLSMNHTFSQLMEYVRGKGGYIDVKPNDYCLGRFQI